MEIGVITNPRSRKNRGRPGRADRLQDIVGTLGEVHATESVDSIKPVLREFLRKRARYWVADGGDGALHWMLRMGMEVMAEDGVSETFAVPLLPTKGGTIDFVANNVGIKGNAESILATLRTHIESGRHIEEVEVDSMLIEGVEVGDDGQERDFRTYGFASAAGGVGQRFFSKYYEHEDPNPRTIVKVVGRTLASLPMATLGRLPGVSSELGRYAREMLEPARVKVTLDGMILPGEAFTGIHVASMSINLGNVFRMFQKAEQPGLMHAIIGSPSPVTMVANLPRMTLGKELRGRDLIDRPCRELVLEARDEQLMAPVIDGEYYRNLRRISFTLGPRVRIPKVSSLAN
ncbi:diacylglycerol/lipid kinase family protein [Haliangium sp.]|uniref:diacylglycerol/lipid kinase family protein n=1 Tax=Haliangium sp. TaxID=2663208 RepID=UPI003D14A5CC